MNLPSFTGVLENFMATAVWIGLGDVLGRLQVVLHPVYLRRLLPFEVGGRIGLCYGLAVEHHQGRTYFAEEGNVATICVLHDVLMRTLGRVSIHPVNHLSYLAAPDYLQAILTVSGPRFNRITEDLMGALGSPVRFSKSQDLLVCRSRASDTEESYPTVRSDKPRDLARRCHGVVLSGVVTTSTGQRQKALICAGTSTLSTFGAAIYLKGLSSNRRLVADLRRQGLANPRRRWGLIVEVTNRLEPKHQKLVPFNEQLVHIKVVRYLTEKDFGEAYKYVYSAS